MAEPDYDRQHVFSEFAAAQSLYEALLRDLSLSDEQRERLHSPRQAHGDTWVVDKVVA
jgi:hypothetical protein